MMEWFQLKFKPLELYTFGTEQGSEYDGVKGTGKESYIMTSATIPDQTTLFGTVRWLLLKKANLLKTNYEYSEADREAINKINKTIGPESFRFLIGEDDKTNKGQNFGALKQISPLFLTNTEDDILIKNPFCNTSTDTYRPMQMADPILTSKGTIHTPVQDDSIGYKAKEGYAGGYINLKNRTNVSETELFEKYILTGNQISQEQNKKGFYKREAYKLNSKYSFSIYVETEDGVFSDHESHITYMGRKNNAFQVSITKVSEADANLVKKVEDSLNTGDVWYYALSDVFFNGEYKVKDYCIVEEKHIRNIKTVLFGTCGYAQKRRKSTRINLAAKGSCFLGEKPTFNDLEHCKTAGYNYIVKIGGKS